MKSWFHVRINDALETRLADNLSCPKETYPNTQKHKQTWNTWVEFIYVLRYIWTTNRNKLHYTDQDTAGLSACLPYISYHLCLWNRIQNDFGYVISMQFGKFRKSTMILFMYCTWYPLYSTLHTIHSNKTQKITRNRYVFLVFIRMTIDRNSEIFKPNTDCKWLISPLTKLEFISKYPNKATSLWPKKENIKKRKWQNVPPDKLLCPLISLEMFKTLNLWDFFSFFTGEKLQIQKKKIVAPHWVFMRFAFNFIIWNRINMRIRKFFVPFEMANEVEKRER